VAAERFPAKTRPRGPPLLRLIISFGIRSEERQGEGWRVLSRLARADVTRPEEGGAQWLKDRGESFLCEYLGGTRAEAACDETCLRGARAEDELGNCERKVTLEDVLRGARC